MLAMAAFLPEVSTLLFGARLSPDHVASFYLGVAFLAASIGNSLGRHILIPEGATPGSLFATLAGAAVGIPLSVVFSVKWGSGRGNCSAGNQRRRALSADRWTRRPGPSSLECDANSSRDVISFESTGGILERVSRRMWRG